MKKFIRLFVLLLLTTNLLMGQNISPDSSTSSQYQSITIKYRKLQLGVIGAIGILQLPKAPAERNSKYFEEFGSLSGIHLQYNLKRNAAITLNCLYEQKNWKSDFRRFVGINQMAKNTFHELTFPLLFKYSPFYRNFFVSAGPYLGIILQKEVKGYQDGNYIYKNPFEAGAAIGIGFNIPLSNRISVILEGRDYINIITSKALSDYTKMNTATFQMGVFYKFGKTEQIEIKKAIDTAWQKQKKVFVKLFYSPQIAGNAKAGDYVYLQDSYYGNSHTSYHYDGNLEILQYGQELGVLLEINRRKNFNVNIGLTFDQLRYQTKTGTLFYSGWGDILGSYSGSYENVEIHYTLEFLSLPVIFNFVHKAKKCSFHAGGGIELKKLFFSEVSLATKSYRFRHGEKTSTNKIDLFNLFAIANVGIDVPLSKNFFVFIEPTFKYELGMLNIPIVDSKVQLWSAGCKLGIKF